MALARRLLIGIGLLGLAALALRLAFFGISVARVPASSDEALSPLQAKMIVEQGRRPLLVMANPCQFPVEAYLQAPFIKVLPRNALGARVLPWALSLAATAVFILTLGRLAPLRAAWPALLLLLFPSAYVLMIGSAYFIPQYSSLALLCSLALHLAVRMRAAPNPVGWALASGFCAGLAFSNHRLALPLLAVLGAYALLGPDWKNQRRIIPAFAAGALLGLLPYFLAAWLIPGAFGGGAAGIVPLGAALQRIWDLTLNSALPGVMGIAPCLFPDNRPRLWQIPGLNAGFAVAWVLVLTAATAVSARSFRRRMKAAGRPTLEAEDIFPGLAWVGLLSFLFGAQTLSHAYRCLLPVAWAFPFLVGQLHARAPRPARAALGAAAILLAGFNLFASLALMRTWAAPGFAAREADLFELQPAIDYLEARGVRHACASYWLAYRLTYATDGRVLCSQPFNERFPGWPTPFKAAVDAADDVAYLTAPRRAFNTGRFEADLAAMGVDCQRENFGEIRVYTDFRKRLEERGIADAPGRNAAAPPRFEFRNGHPVYRR